MMKISTFKIVLLLTVFGLNALIINAQITFTNANTSLHSDAGVAGSNANNRSGNSVCIIDVNNDGLDDIVKLDNNQYLRIEYQQPGGTFTYQYIGDCGHSGAWGISMADVDHNGYKDLLYGDGSQAYLLKLNNTGTAFLGATVTLPNGNVFCQNVNFMDVNNDGWEDIFSTNDVDESRLWVNNGTGNFPAEQANSIINFNLTPGTGPGPTLSGGAPNHQYDESGNYSSVWTDFDNDGDVDFYIPHCRQGSSPGDVRRLDRLWVNNGNGTYTEAGATYNLNSGEEDWTSSFGDIDNDGDFDQFLTRVNVASTLFTNDGTGHMTTLSTLAGGFNQPYQSVFVDFDNDTYVDILMSGVSAQELYRNNGDNTFSQVSNGILGFANTMLSFATGDVNHDGKIDVYASYGTGYHTPSGSTDDVYYMNSTTNSNNFLTLDLRGTASTDGALGARVYIYGPWGVQTREVRASESYGTCNTFQLHFGLGSATAVDSVVINWPATGSPNTHIVNPAINQFLVVTEGGCVSPDNVITYTGNPVICAGGTLTLNAASGSGYTYLWSTGETTQSIAAATAGDYTVRVTAPGNACTSWAAAVTLSVSPDETPTITVGGPTTFCPGGSVTLTSSSAIGNTWTTTDTTQSIDATAAGIYTVAYAGSCQSWVSDTVVITLLAAPSTPVTTDDNLTAVGSGTITSTGADITWYDAASGGNIVGAGSPFITPIVSSTTTYYAEDVISYGASTGNAVGDTNIVTATNNGNTINGFLKFDVSTNCTLVSVQCSTSTAGDRVIELRDNVGTVLQSDTINIGTGTSTLTLNYNLTPGTDYQLGTNSAYNISIFGAGSISPRLVRENPASFPYTLAGALDITTGDNGSGSVNAYYYFFNWVVDVAATDICTSVRTPATVFVDFSGIQSESDIQLNIYPNPTTDFVNVEFTSPEPGEAMLSIFDMLGKKIYDVNLGVVNGSVIKTIATSTYAKGMYNVKLTINNKEYNTRIIVK